MLKISKFKSRKWPFSKGNKKSMRPKIEPRVFNTQYKYLTNTSFLVPKYIYEEFISETSRKIFFLRSRLLDQLQAGTIFYLHITN